MVVMASLYCVLIVVFFFMLQSFFVIVQSVRWTNEHLTKRIKCFSNSKHLIRTLFWFIIICSKFHYILGDHLWREEVLGVGRERGVDKYTCCSRLEVTIKMTQIWPLKLFAFLKFTRTWVLSAYLNSTLNTWKWCYL